MSSLKQIVTGLGLGAVLYFGAADALAADDPTGKPTANSTECSAPVQKQKTEGTKKDKKDTKTTTSQLNESYTNLKSNLNEQLGEIRNQLGNHIKDYNSLSRKVKNLSSTTLSPEYKGILATLEKALKPAIDNLNTLWKQTEDDCIKYNSFLVEKGHGHAEKINEIKKLPSDGQVEAFRNLFEGSEANAKEAEELHQKCSKAENKLKEQITVLENIIANNITETEEDKVDRIERVLGDNISFMPFVGFENYGSNTKFAGAELCYGRKWKACAKGGAFFGGEGLKTTTPLESTAPQINAVGPGYQEVSLSEKETEKMSKYNLFGGMSVMTPNWVNSSRWSFALGAEIDVYSGTETKNTTSKRTNQLQTSQGNNLGAPHEVTAQDPNKESIYSFVPGAKVQIGYKDFFVEGATGLDTKQMKPIYKSLLGYRF